MSSFISRWFSNAQPQTAAALLPGNRFFVRRINVESATAQEQVSLGLEAISPFPLEQMLVGHVLSADGTQALAYAAHRRRFTPEESFAWPDDCQVIPEFVALCGIRPNGAGIIVHQGDERLIALAWGEGDTLPAAIVVAEIVDSDQASIVREAAARADLPADTAVTAISGALFGETIEGQLSLKAEGNAPMLISKKALDAADIRDRDFLAQRRKKESTNMLIWNATRLGLATLVVSFILELVAMGISLRSNKLQARNESQQPLVADIEAAQAISARIIDLGVKRPLSLEMLALANEHRPSTLDFQRITCKNNTLLEVEARTTNAGDIGIFEHALSGLPEVASAASRDIRARESSASFTIAITFKPEVLRKSAATPKQ